MGRLVFAKGPLETFNYFVDGMVKRFVHPIDA